MKSLFSILVVGLLFLPISGFSGDGQGLGESLDHDVGLVHDVDRADVSIDFGITECFYAGDLELVVLTFSDEVLSLDGVDIDCYLFGAHEFRSSITADGAMDCYQDLHGTGPSIVKGRSLERMPDT